MDAAAETSLLPPLVYSFSLVRSDLAKLSTKKREREGGRGEEGEEG